MVRENKYICKDTKREELCTQWYRKCKYIDGSVEFPSHNYISHAEKILSAERALGDGRSKCIMSGILPAIQSRTRGHQSQTVTIWIQSTNF